MAKPQILHLPAAQIERPDALDRLYRIWPRRNDMMSLARPSGMGVAYECPERDVIVLVLWPFNVLAGWLRSLWIATLWRKGKIERLLEREFRRGNAFGKRVSFHYVFQRMKRIEEISSGRQRYLARRELIEWLEEWGKKCQ